MDYLDFGSSSDSDNENAGDFGMACELDSDEEEQADNRRLMKMFNLHEPPPKHQRSIQDFEAEMEAELDKRAVEIETQGGMEHQRSLSRSSSTSSLNKSPRASPVPGSSAGNGIEKKSSIVTSKRRHSGENENASGAAGSRPKSAKSVRFDAKITSSQNNNSQNVPEAASASVHQTSTSASQTGTVAVADKKAKNMYDELYFDSDESEGEEDKQKQKKADKRRFLTNDELFYDPESDDKDQAWMDKQKKKSYGESSAQQQQLQVKAKTSQGTSSTPMTNKNNKNSPSPASTSAAAASTSKPKNVSVPTTDAILNCPACFTAVCNDCQRHELYVGQYRAMFVVNCLINQQETLQVPEKVPKRFRKGKSKGANALDRFTPTSSSDVFYPVLCKVCRTQVAMYDSEEVYHFFNVLASQP